MGSDKALLSIRPGEPPLLGLVIERVRSLTDDLFLVGVPRPGYEQFQVPLIEDEQPDLGPLGGIATALAQAVHPDCLVVACDMPFLNVRLLAYMAGLPRSAYDALVPKVPASPTMQASEPVYQPLHAIYRRTCRAPIANRLAAGERRATSFYRDVRVQTLDAGPIRPFDPDLRSFFSADSPDSLRQAREWLIDSSPGN
jgi:molybdopterin-guanine dinucleotide biosynthesis protein A